MASLQNVTPMKSLLKATECRKRGAIIDDIVMPAVLGMGLGYSDRLQDQFQSLLLQSEAVAITRVDSCRYIDIGEEYRGNIF